MNLHIGCGKRDFGRDWVHIDAADFPHVTSKDIWLNDVEDDSVDLIYACHFIEYFDRDEALDLLSRWHRVMKRDATIRLAVPDFTELCRAVQLKGFTLQDILGPLYGKMRVNDQFIYHKTVYDFHDLRDLLIRAGFSNVKKYDWRKTEHGKFDDHSQAYLPKMAKDTGMLISLNVEAVK
jgi:predicted SAM-dependent methyltransferase